MLSNFDTSQEFAGYLQDIISPIDLKKFRIPHATTPDYYDQYMGHFGVEFFLNTISAGQLPAEVALDMNIPVMTFTTWFTERTTPEQRDRAREMCAESLLVKSQAVLLILDGDATTQEVSLAKEYSKRLAWIAERLDSDHWGPPRPSVVEAPPTFSITLNSVANDTVESEREKLRNTFIEHGPMTLETVKLIEN